MQSMDHGRAAPPPHPHPPPPVWQDPAAGLCASATDLFPGRGAPMTRYSSAMAARLQKICSDFCMPTSYLPPRIRASALLRLSGRRAHHLLGGVYLDVEAAGTGTAVLDIHAIQTALADGIHVGEALRVHIPGRGELAVDLARLFPVLSERVGPFLLQPVAAVLAAQVHPVVDCERIDGVALAPLCLGALEFAHFATDAPVGAHFLTRQQDAFFFALRKFLARERRNRPSRCGNREQQEREHDAGNPGSH